VNVPVTEDWVCSRCILTMLLRRRELLSVTFRSGAICLPICARRLLALDSLRGLPLLDMKNSGILGMPIVAGAMDSSVSNKPLSFRRYVSANF
jgi:hypothetical protein